MNRNAPIIYAPFSKVEKQDDGTLIVSGIASTESKDSDGEIVKASAIRAALPDYLTFGAVREMHQPIAAGTAISANVDDNGVTNLTAHIVDAQSVKKVETGVLKGFSIGGKVTKRDSSNKKVILGLRLSEISLVDRPANPDALITLVKFDGTGKVKALAAGDTEEPIAKGMYDVSALARLILDLNYLRLSAESEAVYEGDGSAMPGRLATITQSLCACLLDMVAEETAELLGLTATKADGSIDVAKAAETITATAQFADLVEKKGAKFSKSTVETLGAVHKMIDDCSSFMHGLGYTKAANQEEEPPMNDTEKKAAADAAAASEALTKRAKDLETENASLTERVEKAEKAAADAKAAADTATEALKKATEITEKLAAAGEQLLAKGVVTAVPRSADTGRAPTDEVAKGKESFQDALRASHAKPLSPIRGTLAAR